MSIKPQIPLTRNVTIQPSLILSDPDCCGVPTMVISPDGQRLFIGRDSINRAVIIDVWNTTTQELETSIHIGVAEYSMDRMNVSNDNTRLYVVQDELVCRRDTMNPLNILSWETKQYVYCWDLINHQEIPLSEIEQQLHLQEKPYRYIAKDVVESVKYKYTCSPDIQIQRTCATQPPLIFSPALTQVGECHLIESPDGMFLYALVYSRDTQTYVYTQSHVYKWEASTGQLQTHYPTSEDMDPYQLDMSQISPDGRWMFTMWGPEPRIVDLTSGQVWKVHHDKEDDPWWMSPGQGEEVVNGTVLSPDGTKLYVSYSAGDIMCWDLQPWWDLVNR